MTTNATIRPSLDGLGRKARQILTSNQLIRLTVAKSGSRERIVEVKQVEIPMNAVSHGKLKLSRLNAGPHALGLTPCNQSRCSASNRTTVNMNALVV